LLVAVLRLDVGGFESGDRVYSEYARRAGDEDLLYLLALQFMAGQLPPSEYRGPLFPVMAGVPSLSGLGVAESLRDAWEIKGDRR